MRALVTPSRTRGNSVSRSETSTPVTSSSPNFAQAADISSLLKVVSWSVKAIAEIPRSCALSASCVGVSEPSENDEWV